MPKINIIHKCGHDQEHNFSGDRRTINQKVKDSAAEPCSACRKSQARRSTDQAIAAMNLPALTGSDKQVKWAKQLRHDIAAQVLDTPGAEHNLAAIVKALSMETSAHWWIENRNSPRQAYRELVNRAAKQAADK